MFTFLKRFYREDSGASAAEYALLLAIISAGIAAGMGTLGTAITTSLETASSCIDAGQSCIPPTP